MSDISDIANIVIAGVSVLLGIYIFVYQRNKDKVDKKESLEKENEAKKETLRLQEQSINLLWFKELIIQPHLGEINNFYSRLHSIEEIFLVDDITEDVKFEVSSFIKEEQSKLRKSFVDILHSANSQLHSDIKKNLDDLIDKLIEKIFDPELLLNDKLIFEKEISTLITYYHNDLISKIYNFKGN